MDNFYKDIKTRLIDHESIVSENSWIAVSVQIPTYNKRRRLIYTLLIALIGIIILFTDKSGILDSKHNKNRETGTENTLVAEANSSDNFNLIPNEPEKINQENSNIDNPKIRNHYSISLIKSNDKYFDLNHSKSATIEILYPDLKNDLINKASIIEKPIIQKIEKLTTIYNSQLEIIPPIKKVPLKCNSLKGDSRNFSIEIYGGPDIPISQINSKSGENSRTYSDLRRDTESPLVSYNAGIRLKLDIGSNIFIKFGTEFSQINEKFNLADSSAIRIQTVIDSVFDSNGNLIDISSTTITERGTRIVQHHNRIRSISLPVSIGYQETFKNLSYYAYGGLAFTLHSSYSGKIILPNLEPGIIGNDQGAELSPYKTNFGLVGLAGIGMTWQIGENTTALAESSFRYNLNSMTESSYPLDQKYLLVGLRAGLNYKF